MSQPNALGVSPAALLWLAVRELPSQALSIFQARNERHRTQRDRASAVSSSPQGHHTIPVPSVRRRIARRNELALLTYPFG